MSRLRLVTYGGFKLMRRDGSTVRLRGRKVEGLCAYLALEGGATRETLRGLLWGRVSPQAGRHSVSQTILQLHRQLAAVQSERPLITTDETISLARKLIKTDLHAVERLLRRNTPHSLALACRLSRGDFLAGMNLDAPRFDAWLASRRLQARAAASEAYWRLATLQMARGRTVDALLSAFRLVEIDPVNERGHLLLMAVYAEQGQVGAALRQYDTCARLLEAAFHVKPGAAMDAMRQKLLAPAEASVRPEIDAAADADRRRDP
jgi:DNA-binding SARP family transcriptional activator